MIDKDYFKSIIINTENKVKDNVGIDFKLEVNSINRNAIDNSHLKELISSYIANNINEYESLKNYYKSSYEGYLDLTDSIKELNYTEADRIDFIATMLLGMYEEKTLNDDNDKVIRLDFLNQIKDLESIVYDTYSLKLKAVAFSKYLENLSKPVTNLSALEVAYLAYYLIESKSFRIRNKNKKDWINDFSRMNNNVSPKNIEINFNAINNDKSKRISKRSDKIQNVIAHMKNNFSDNTEAIGLAETELAESIITN